MDILSKQKRIQTWRALLAEVSSRQGDKAVIEAHIKEYSQLLFALWGAPQQQDSAIEKKLVEVETRLECLFEDMRVNTISHIPTAKTGSIY